MNPLTPLLVVTGTATLSNALGAPRCGGEDAAPAAVAASTAFGLELYGEFARLAEDRDLCFSPFSIANALAMAGEGARGLTADELAQALHVPRAPADDETSPAPFAWSVLHAGLRELNTLFDPRVRAEALRVARGELEELVGRLTELRARADAAKEAGELDELRELNQAALKLEVEVREKEKAVPACELTLANSLWAEQSYPLSPRYVEALQTTYEIGSVIPADFKTDPLGEVVRINEWVAARTANRITDLLSDTDVSRDTRLVLLNALHFDGAWSTPFDPAKTREVEFKNLGGSTSSVPMMSGKVEDAGYAALRADGSAHAGSGPDAGGFQVVELPYRGGDLSMVILLPADPAGLAALEARLTPEALGRWLAALEVRPVEVELPRFEARSSFSLREALSALGVRAAFSPRLADFRGMSADVGYADELYIDRALHQASVEVTERGTEASAATSIQMRKRSGLRSVPRVACDHPFVYLIRHRESGVLLFAGRVARP